MDVHTGGGGSGQSGRLWTGGGGQKACFLWTSYMDDPISEGKLAKQRQRSPIRRQRTVTGLIRRTEAGYCKRSRCTRMVQEANSTSDHHHSRQNTRQDNSPDCWCPSATSDDCPDVRRRASVDVVCCGLSRTTEIVFCASSPVSGIENNN